MKRIHKATMVLAGALLLGTGLFTACPNNSGPADPSDTPPQVNDGEGDTEEEEEENTPPVDEKPKTKELFNPKDGKLDGIIPVFNIADWSATNLDPKSTTEDGTECFVWTMPESGVNVWYAALWQHPTDVVNNTIDISGYKYLILTVKDDFGENKSLKGSDFKIKDNKPNPDNGTEVNGGSWIKISGPDEKGWRTVTASLKEFADGGVDLTSVMCINFAGWQDNPDKDGKLYISKVTLSQEAPAVSEDTTPGDDDESPAGQEPNGEGEDDGDDDEQPTDPGANRDDDGE